MRFYRKFIYFQFRKSFNKRGQLFTVSFVFSLSLANRLLKLLNPTANGENSKHYIQEQVITTLAMVTDTSEATLAKVHFYECCCFHLSIFVADCILIRQHYPSIMPLLLNILRTM